MGTIETITRSYLQDIANAIRRKSGTEAPDDGDTNISSLPAEMQSQIREALPTARNTLNSFNPSSYTHIYSTSVNYGTISNITSRVDSYTTYSPSSYNEYNGEEQIGMYYGLESSSEMEVSVAVFTFGRYSGQNKTLIATLEYKDSNGTWHELDDFEITNTISNPTYVAVPLPSGVYGVRWNHKKEPKKSSSNNLFFYSMWLFALPHSGEEGEEVKYYPSQMATAILNIPSGGGGASWNEIESFSNPFSLYQATAITLSNYSFSINTLNASMAMSAGAPYEGFIIALNNLTVGNFYKLIFDFQISGNLSWYGSYGWGYKITKVADSTYSSGGNWPQNIEKNGNKQHFVSGFVAEATTMYLSFNMADISNGTYTISITDAVVKELNE